MHTENLAIDWPSGWSDGWNDFWREAANFVPKLVMFLVILAIGWIIASIVERIVGRILDRVGFNRVLERSGLQNVLARSNYHATNILAKLAKYAVMLITLQTAFNVWGPNAVSNMLGAIVNWLPKAFVAVILVVVAGAIARAARDLIVNALGGLGYGRALATVASAFIWGIGIIAALYQVGIATAITTPILVCALATLGGILVVGMGGGLIRPMQERWGRWLGTLERDIPAMRSESSTTARPSTPMTSAANSERTWYQQGASNITTESGYRD